MRIKKELYQNFILNPFTFTLGMDLIKLAFLNNLHKGVIPTKDYEYSFCEATKEFFSNERLVVLSDCGEYLTTNLVEYFEGSI